MTHAFRLPQNSSRAAVIVTVIACLSFLSACNRTIATKVNAFAVSGTNFQQGVFKVVVKNLAAPDSLESQLYKRKTEGALRERGFQVMTSEAEFDASSPYFVAELAHTVSRLEDVHRDNNTAFLTSGHRVHHTDLGVGVVVVDGRERIPNHYRRLELVVYELRGDARKRVYEVSGVSEGRCGTMSEVFDPMLSAMLQDFPADNGSLKRVKVKTQNACP